MKLKQFIFALVAMLSSFAFTANAQVAKVGNTEYATIDEAISKWTNGTTLTLLADVTLSDVIQLSSTEHHILDLGTYTMTAASKKDAIQIVNNGRTSASYALDIKADAKNPGGITASGKAVVKTTGKSGVKDRPIIRFYGGVLTGTNVVYHSGSNGTNCPQFWFYGGEFNGTIYANRALFQFYGGTFNGNIQISVDSSAYALVAGGKFKKLSNLYGSSLNSDKFTIGSAKGNYNRGIYVDAKGYYVITSAPITEVSAKYPAVKKESYNSNNYFYYSAAAANGMFYEVASMAGTGSNVTVWEGAKVVEELKGNEALEYTPELPAEVQEFEVELTDVVLDENTSAPAKVVFTVTPSNANGEKVSNPASPITFRIPVPAAWAGKQVYVSHNGARLDGKYTVQQGNYVEVTSASFSEFAVEPVPPVAKIGNVEYTTLIAAVEAVEDGGTITLIANETFTENNRTNNSGWWDGLGYSGDKSFTIDLNGFTVSQDGSLNDYLLWFKNAGSKENTITIKNGTLDAGTTAFCALCTANSHDNKLTVNTENVNLINNISNGSTVKIRAGSVYNAKTGTIITGKNSYLGIENWNATVNIYDGAEIYMNGTSSYNGCLVGVGGNGTVNVYGGKGKGVSGGFIAMTSGGTINVAGGEWIANTDGTFANSNKSVLIAQSDKQYNAGAGNAVVNVTGGTFKGGYNCYGNKAGDAQINISGGNFNANPTSYVAADYIAVENSGVWTVAMAAAKIGAKAYATLEEAFAAAIEGETVVLLNDATPALTSQRAITKAAVIDLGGKTLTLTEDDLYFGTTTFKNGTIIVDPSVKPSTAVFWMFANQTLTFDAVKVVATGVTGTYLIGLDGNNSDLNIINGSEIVVENTTALDLDIICVNASTGNDILVDNSKVNVTNLDGRVFFRGNYTVKDSEVALAGITKAGFRIEAGQTLSVEGNSTITIEGEPRDGGIHLTDITAVYTKAETATVASTLNEVIPAAVIGAQKFASLQAAVNAVQNGETITLRSDITENVTLTEKTGLYYTIDGDGKKMTGTITVSSLSDTEDNRRITIKNINFVDTVNARDFITSTTTNHYPRLTVEGCSFTGTGAEAANSVAIRLKSSHSVVIKNCTGAGLHSFLQNTSGWNLTIENVKVTDSKSGLALGTVQGVTVKGCEIAAAGYGIRMDAGYNNNAVLESNKVEAFIPVVVRKATVDSNITVKGENEFTASNTDGIWFAAGTSEYEANGEMPTATTGKVIVTINDANLSEEGVYGDYVPVAKIGDVEYTTLEAAFKAATSGCTIDIIHDVKVDYNWDARYTGAKFTVPVTINGNGKTIKFTASVNDNNYQAPFRFEADATVNNLTIDMSEVTDNRFRAISSKGNLTVDGCKFIGKDESLNCRAIIFGEGAGANVGNLAIAITNSEFINWKRGITDNENGQDVKTATITGNTLENAAVYVSAKENVTFTGNTVEGAYVDIRSYTANSSLNVTATGNTLEENTDTAYNYIKATGNIDQEGFKVYAVAKIGDVEYTTIEKAYAALQEGDEIVILKKGSYALTVKNNVTITGAVAGVEFANIGAFGCNGANVTFNNVTFTYAENSTYKGLQHSGNLVYNNCIFNGQVFLYGQSETFNGCTFNTTDSANYNVWTYGAANVAFNDCTFNCAGKSVLIYAESTSVTNNVTVSNSQFIATQAVDGKAAIEMDSSLSGAISLAIDNTTTANGFAAGNVSGNSLWNNKKGNSNDANNDITVQVGDEVVLAPIYEAVIAGVGYRTLQEAINAAVLMTGDVTIEIMAGTYAQDINLTNTAITTGNVNVRPNITFKAVEGQEVVLAGTVTLGYRQQNVGASMWNGKVTFNGITFDHAENGKHSLDIQDVKGIALVNCKVIGDGEYGIGSNAGNATTDAVFTSCTFENGSMQVLGQLGAHLVVDNSICNDFSFNVQGGAAPGMTIKNTTFNMTLTDAHVGESFYVVRTNASPINIEAIKLNVDSEVSAVAADQAKWGIFWARKDADAQWNIAGCEVNLTEAAMAQTELLLTKNDATTYEKAKDRIIVTNLTSTSNSVADLIARTEGCATVNGVGYKDGKLDTVGMVAVIGNKVYPSLAEAVVAAKSGATITLVDNVNVGSITIQKGLTLDGAGYTITGHIHANLSNTKMTVKNVHFDGDNKAYDYAIRVDKANSFVVENCTADNYKYSFLYANKSNNNLTVKNVTVTNCANYGVYFASFNNATIENLTVIGAEYGVAAGNAANSKVNIKNCTFDVADVPLYIQEKGAGEVTFTFDGVNEMGNEAFYTNEYVNVDAVAQVGTKVYGNFAQAFAEAQDGQTVKLLSDISLGWDDVVVVEKYKVLAVVEGKNITLDMNGKKISVDHRSTEAADRIYSVICVQDGAGLTVKGNGSIDVTTGVTDENVMPKVAYMFWKRGTTGYLVIEDGEYHMDNSEDSMVYTNGSGIVTVNGGTFVLDANGTRLNGFPWIFNVAGNDAGYINVNDGTYNYDIRKQFWAAEVKLGDGLTTTNNGDGTWTVVPAVAAVGEESYGSIQEAINAAQDGETVTLVKDVVYNDNDVFVGSMNKTLVEVAGKNIVLDMNGKNIDVTYTGPNYLLSVIHVADGAGLTVTGEGSIDVKGLNADGTAAKNIAYVFYKSGTTGYLTIENGTFHMNDAADSMVYTNGDEIVTINGGTFILDAVASQTNGFPVIFSTQGNNERQIVVNAGTFNYDINHQIRPFEPYVAPEKAVKKVGDMWTIVPAEAYVTEMLGGWVNEAGEYAHNVGYATVAEAIAATNELGKVVTLVKDVELGATQNITKSITIDGNGKSITTAEGVATNNHAAFYIDGESMLDVTIKNTTFDGINGCAVRSLEANVTIDNCVFQDATNTGIQGLVRLTQGNATVKNSKFLNNTSQMALSFNYDAGNETDELVVDNCLFEGNTANGTAVLYYVKGASCTIKDSEFIGNTVNCSGNGATIYLGFTENNVVTGNLFKNNNVVEATSSTRVAGAIFFGYEANVCGNVFENNTASNANGDLLGQVCVSTYYDCAINLGGNYWGECAPVYGKDYTVQHQTGAATFALDSYYTAYTFEDGDLELLNLEDIAYVAKIGKISYASLQAAYDAVAADGTINVINDAVGAGVVINKNVTIDFGGHTYEFNQGVGSAGTESNGFQILKNNTVTLKNGSLQVADGAESKFAMLIQNYANLTLTNMNLYGEGLNRSASGWSYALSNNSGNVLIDGETNIYANSQGANAFAFDSYLDRNYEAPTVTVETTGEITGNIEVSANLIIKGGTYTIDVEEWCPFGYTAVANDDATYTVKTGITIVDNGRVMEYSNPENIDVEYISYSRVFKNSNWQAFYVPFNVSVDDLEEAGFEVAYFTNLKSYDKDGNGEIDDIAMEYQTILKENAVLNANYPYLIRNKNASSTNNVTLNLVYEDATLYSSNENPEVGCSSIFMETKFYGNYSKKTGSDVAGKMAISGGKLLTLIETSELYAYRILISTEVKPGSPYTVSPEAMKSIRIVVDGEDGGSTTSVESVQGIGIEDAIFDLSGRRVLEAEKGIYIKNGKKIYVK